MLKTQEEYGYVVKNGILAFQRGPLSQWYGGFKSQDSTFTMGSDIEYNCTEQWMMAMKAKTFKDEETYKLIMSTNDPREQKAAGRRVKNFNQKIWNSKKESLVFMGNVAKFSKNKELGDFLLATDPWILVEASPWDDIWGCGTGLDDDRTFDRKQWQGENLLGKTLEKVRENLFTQRNGI